MLENINLAFQGVWSHKLRSFLTMLGIIIGIAAIITIVSTIQGTNEQIKQNLIGAGNNVVRVTISATDSQNYFDLNYSALPEGTDPVTGEEAFHRGTDLACSEGTLVLAAMDGVVTAARRSATYGNYLCLSHSGGQETLYAHLQYLFVRAGEVVQAGQPLGTAGETGRSTGAHLHFELLEQGVRYDAGALLGLP